MKDERVYLSHMLKCVSRLEVEVAKGEAEFRASDTVRDAVVLNLAIMGEAIKRLSRETRAHAPQVPWSQITKLRDILIHKYDQIDLQEVWDIARLDVPPFKTQIEQLLQDLARDPAESREPEAGGLQETQG